MGCSMSYELALSDSEHQYQIVLILSLSISYTNCKVIILLLNFFILCLFLQEEGWEGVKEREEGRGKREERGREGRRVGASICL